MKRFHVNLTVTDLDRSIAFYSTLFASEPTVRRPDYAKWMLEDPRVNFAVSTRGSHAGIDHVGLQAESDEELAEIRTRLERAEQPVIDQPDVTCCYARSTKAWIRDPDGVAWETFVSRGQTATYGDGGQDSAARLANEMPATACCAGEAPATAKSCC